MMKKYFLVVFVILLIVTLTGCSNSNDVKLPDNIEKNNISNSKINKEKVYDKYYELLSKEYKSFVWLGTFKVYEDNNDYMTDFLKRYYIDFLDINNDGIDELFIFEYQFGPYGETQIENSNYVEYKISILSYSNDINDRFEGIDNLKILYSKLMDGPMRTAVTNYSFSKDKLAFFKSISMLDAMNIFYKKSNNNSIMTRDYVESLSKQWSIYNNFYELQNIENGNTELYLSGTNDYSKIIDKELIVIDKNELDSVISSLVKINFDKMDSSKINTNINYPDTE